MSRCPFWSIGREKVECYNECPILTSEFYKGKDGTSCIFHDCTDSNSLNFRENANDDYNFLELSVYDEESGTMNY